LRLETPSAPDLSCDDVAGRERWPERDPRFAVPRIYISYWRRDALLAEAAGLIAPRLAQASADIAVASGADDSLLALDPAVVRHALQDTALLMVLIGPSTAEPSPATRIEVESARDKRLPIMPVLVNGARMPTSPIWSNLAGVQITSLDLRADRDAQLDQLVRTALSLVRQPRPSAPKTDRAATAKTGLSRRALSAAELDSLRQQAAAFPTALPASVAARARGPIEIPLANAPPTPLPAGHAAAASGPTAAVPPEPPPRRKRHGVLLAGTAALLLGGSSAYLVLSAGSRTNGWTTAHDGPREPTRPPPAKSIYAIRWATDDRKGPAGAPAQSGPRGMLPGPFFAMAAAAAVPPPLARTEVVDVSAFSPNEGGAGDEVLVQIYLHRPRQLARVEDRAVKKDPDAEHRETATLATEIVRGQKIGIELACPALRIAEPRQELTWNGEPAVCSFVVALPPAAAGRSHTLSVRVRIDDMPIGRLAFMLRVAARTDDVDAEKRIQGVDAKRYRYAFMSYSSADRVEVLKNARLLRALGIDFFQDLLSLEAGQQFEPMLFSEIDKCDLFLLFWSKTAAASDWVIRETEHALERQAASREEAPEIKPIILDGPPVPLPPPSLGRLHFNDFITHVIAGIESAQRPS
jgi:TIR domain-containing protein